MSVAMAVLVPLSAPLRVGLVDRALTHKCCGKTDDSKYLKFTGRQEASPIIIW